MLRKTGLFFTWQLFISLCTLKGGDDEGDAGGTETTHHSDGSVTTLDTANGTYSHTDADGNTVSGNIDGSGGTSYDNADGSSDYYDENGELESHTDADGSGWSKGEDGTIQTKYNTSNALESFFGITNITTVTYNPTLGYTTVTDSNTNTFGFNNETGGLAYGTPLTDSQTRYLQSIVQLGVAPSIANSIAVDFGWDSSFGDMFDLSGNISDTYVQMSQLGAYVGKYGVGVLGYLISTDYGYVLSDNARKRILAEAINSYAKDTMIDYEVFLDLSFKEQVAQLTKLGTLDDMFDNYALSKLRSSGLVDSNFYSGAMVDLVSFDTLTGAMTLEVFTANLTTTPLTELPSIEYEGVYKTYMSVMDTPYSYEHNEVSTALMNISRSFDYTLSPSTMIGLDNAPKGCVNIIFFL